MQEAIAAYEAATAALQQQQLLRAANTDARLIAGELTSCNAVLTGGETFLAPSRVLALFERLGHNMCMQMTCSRAGTQA